MLYLFTRTNLFTLCCICLLGQTFLRYAVFVYWDKPFYVLKGQAAAFGLFIKNVITHPPNALSTKSLGFVLLVCEVGQRVCLVEVELL